MNAIQQSRVGLLFKELEAFEAQLKAQRSVSIHIHVIGLYLVLSTTAPLRMAWLAGSYPDDWLVDGACQSG